MSLLGAVAGSLADNHVIAIDNATIEDTQFAPTSAVVRYTLENDGDIMKLVQATPTDLGDWITPKDSFSSYEVRATLNSGTCTTGTTGSWLNLGTTRYWECTNSDACNLTIEIRRGSGAVLDSATIILTAITI